MNILFLSPAAGADYMCDMLYHGLRSIPGCRVTDVNPLEYMWRGTDRTKLRGGGYTLYGLLEPEEDVNRERIRERIRAHEFELVVYGSIQRGTRYLGDVLAAYSPHEVAFVDGEDHQVVLEALLGFGVYFKRELPGYGSNWGQMQEWVKPINFAIPAEKITDTPQVKTSGMAYIDPRDRGTYIYTTEEDYYADYRRSRFGVTIKKAGWDCLRHYEILANQCIPYFIDLMMCPPGTLTQLPKETLLEVNECILQYGLRYFSTAEGESQWNSLNARLQSALRERMTTRAVAEQVLQQCAAMKGKAGAASGMARMRSVLAIEAINRMSPSGESAWRRTLLNGLYAAMVRGGR